MFRSRKTAFSVAVFCASVAKDICFGLQNTVFYPPKDHLSEGETYVFRRRTIDRSESRVGRFLIVIALTLWQSMF